MGDYSDDFPVERYRNDPKTSREKPDLVGPVGGYFPAWNKTNEYDPNSGTSFATPFVVGTAALLMANFGHEVADNPTLMRAVLMASASHSFPNLPHVPVYSGNVDDQAGTGAPRGDRAKVILQNDQYFARDIDHNVDFDDKGYLKDFISFNAQAGDTVRIVMTYDQCQVSTSSLSEKIQADLDMSVLGDGKTQYNNSFVDNTEMIEFTSATRSSFSLKVHEARWDQCSNGSKSTHFVIAWDTLSASELTP